MNAAVAKKTQDTLGKVIKKPPLTEKLLSKPPFRYLHDIFSEVIRSTGFMKGLYGENEMKSDNVKERDAKVIFLQKAIDVVMLVSGEPLAAKPTRIVAGHEPEKTNELLQAIAKCCLNKLSSDDAVKRVLAGEEVNIKSKASTSRSQDKENREGREHHPDREEKKRITEHRGSVHRKDTDQPKEQEGRRGVDKEHRRDRERSDKHHRSEQDHQNKDQDKDKIRNRDQDRDKDRDRGQVRDREKEKDRDRDKEREKDGDRDRERERDRDGEKTRDGESNRDRDKEREKDRDRDRERERDRDGEKDKKRDREKMRDRESNRDRDRDKEKRRDRDREKDRDRDRERHKLQEEKNRNGEVGNSKVRTSDEPPQGSSEKPSKTAEPVAAPDSPAGIPWPSSAKGQQQRPKVGSQEGEAQGPVPLENGHTAGSSSENTLSRRIPRPSSARPAPPRVKRQESSSDVTPAERLSGAKPSAPIIMDGKRLSDEEEDEQFVVEEASPLLIGAPEMEMEPAQELNVEDKHGGLVKKILETKKDYESTPSSTKSKEQNVVSEAACKKEKNLVTREIERVRSSIQTVCGSIFPLGKIMDYIQEDMDAMQAELNTWRKMNKEHAQALQQEQRATDRAVEPLQAELAELEQLIKDQQDKNCAVKANILKNEQRIQKMVAGISFSSKTS